MTDVVPFLGYEDCGGAADWLVRAFGFEEVERFDEDGEVTHVTLRAGDGLVFLGHPGAHYINPLHLRERSDEAARMYDVPWIVDGVWVAVDDLDALVDRARAAEARILTEPEETPHGRQVRVEDIEGHRWMFQQRH
jgi:PhnB protein